MPEQRDPAVTSRMMAAVRNKDGKAEMALRRRLWAIGLRFRKHHKGLVGKPDIVFPGPRIVVFVDGDFWHGNAWRLRGLPSLADLFPSRTEWWVAKIERNMARDQEVTEALAGAGWTVLRYWESRVLADIDAVAAEVEEKVRGASGRGACPGERTREQEFGQGRGRRH